MIIILSCNCITACWMTQTICTDINLGHRMKFLQKRLKLTKKISVDKQHYFNRNFSNTSDPFTYGQTNDEMKRYFPNFLFWDAYVTRKGFQKFNSEWNVVTAFRVQKCTNEVSGPRCGHYHVCQFLYCMSLPSFIRKTL